MNIRTAIAATFVSAALVGTYAATSAAGATEHQVPMRSGHATKVCARAAFLADDYAHTHTGARAERRAVEACAAEVGGF